MANDEDRWTLELVLTPPCYEQSEIKPYRMAIKLERDVVFINRQDVTALRGGPLSAALGGVGFDHAVRMLKKREFRRKLLIQETMRLAAKLANFMQDSEGWHGADRQESADRRRDEGS